MIFNSFTFLWLFPLIFCVYWIFTSKRKLRERYPQIGYAILLIISYTLCIKAEPVYALILLWVTVVTYMSARKIERGKTYGKKRHLFFAGILLAVIPLLIFKYYNFVSSQLNIVLGYAGITIGLPGLNWVLPLGLSFYTLQAVGYLADVYLKRIKAESNWWNYMLFVSFFHK